MSLVSLHALKLLFRIAMLIYKALGFFLYILLSTWNYLFFFPPSLMNVKQYDIVVLLFLSLVTKLSFSSSVYSLLDFLGKCVCLFFCWVARFFFLLNYS